MLVMLLIATLASETPRALEVSPATLAAFTRYIAATEARIDMETRSAEGFLWIDRLPEPRRQAVLRDLKRGDAVVENREAFDTDGPIQVPAGMIQHWFGTIFIPGVSVEDTLKTLQDYNRYPEWFKDIERSRIVDHTGSEFQLYTRAVKKKVITIAMDVESDVTFTALDAERVQSRCYSTGIFGITNPDTPSERRRPSVNLWRLNSYGRFGQRDGGTYMEFESVSLSRDVPPAFLWVMPIVRQVARTEITDALKTTRGVVLRQQARRFPAR
jgi:hypothetical protein